MSTNFEWVLGTEGPRHTRSYPLLGVAPLRALETETARALAPQQLMQRAGLALAQLTMAYYPHATTVWIACGRGNNGGDGLEAALHLQRWGKTVYVSLPEGSMPLPADAAQALQRARAAGAPIHPAPPAQWDCCIDALLGIGLRETPRGATLAAIQAIGAGNGRVIAADLPSGLQADTGATPGACVQARATLSLLALKPGLFTAQGRDACGDIWLHTLGSTAPEAPSAWLSAAPAALPRPHGSHKGSFGDVAVVGGDQGMVGAAVLAGSAALHGGAGRVYLALLDGTQHLALFATHPVLMQRAVEQLPLNTLAVVAGCGGGMAVGRYLPMLIEQAQQLVLDADALNALAAQPDWQPLLVQRASGSTVLTPHPLEAARLLGCSTADVQADRLAKAQALAERFRCTVVLKGSGSIIASPGEPPSINPTGNARLASAGTGDVLAGLTGSLMAQGLSACAAAQQACYRHGAVADGWPATSTLSADRLAEAL